MFTVHRPHINHDAVLDDGCPRCEEHAKTLYNLDDHNLRRLWATRNIEPVNSQLDKQAIYQLELWARIADRARSQGRTWIL